MENMHRHQERFFGDYKSYPSAISTTQSHTSAGEFHTGAAGRAHAGPAVTVYTHAVGCRSTDYTTFATASRRLICEPPTRSSTRATAQMSASANAPPSSTDTRTTRVAVGRRGSSASWRRRRVLPSLSDTMAISDLPDAVAA